MSINSASAMDLAFMNESSDEGRRGGFLRDFFHVLFKRKWFVVLFFLATSVTVLALTFLLSKPMYKGITQILISPGREQLSDLSPTRAGTAGIDTSMEDQIARSIELLTGHSLAEHVVRTIGQENLYPKMRQQAESSFGFSSKKDVVTDEQLFEVAVKKLTKNIEAEGVGKSSLINFGFKHEKPEIAAQVTNLLASLYVERHLGILKNPKTDKFFQEQFQDLKVKLRESEDSLEAFKQRYGITTTVKEEQDATLKQAQSLRTLLGDTRSQQAEVASRIAQLRQQLANTAENPATTNILRDKLTNLELQENELALRYKAENPTLKTLREEIRLVREKVAQQSATKSYGNAAATTGSLFGQLQQELLKNEAEQKALRAREDAQSAKLGELQSRLTLLERALVEFEHLFQARQLNEQNNRLYQTKFEELRISNAMDEQKIANVRVVEPARVPVEPIDAKIALKILAGMVFGLLGGIALALSANILSGRLETVEDVERYLNLPVLVSIPEFTAKR